MKLGIGDPLIPAELEKYPHKAYVTFDGKAIYILAPADGSVMCLTGIGFDTMSAKQVARYVHEVLHN